LDEAAAMPVTEVLKFMQRRITQQSTYRGVRARKAPTDAWIYQELIHELQPTTIVEIGVYDGGSTLMMADLCELQDRGRVLAVELRPEHIHDSVWAHPRIEVFAGDACEEFPNVAARVDAEGPVMVIEDSSHTYENTLAVCRTYAPLVTPGSYLIVEDTICHHGIDVGPKPGPYEAAATFRAEDPEFEMRRDLEAFVLTWNPTGFLQRRPS
jgi:cephalosporin hydroxylase